MLDNIYGSEIWTSYPLSFIFMDNIYYTISQDIRVQINISCNLQSIFISKSSYATIGHIQISQYISDICITDSNSHILYILFWVLENILLPIANSPFYLRQPPFSVENISPIPFITKRLLLLKLFLLPLRSQSVIAHRLPIYI